MRGRRGAHPRRRRRAERLTRRKIRLLHHFGPRGVLQLLVAVLDRRGVPQAGVLAHRLDEVLHGAARAGCGARIDSCAARQRREAAAGSRGELTPAALRAARLVPARRCRRAARRLPPPVDARAACTARNATSNNPTYQNINVAASHNRCNSMQ